MQVTFHSDTKIVQLADIADIGTGSSNTNEAVEDGKYPFFVRSQEPLRKNDFEYDETAIITAGDGVGVGKVYHLKEETAERFLESMEMQKAPLGCVFCGGESGNPAWFSKPYFSELKELSGDRGGKKVLKRHWESVIPFRVEAAWELKDLDRKEDL